MVDNRSMGRAETSTYDDDGEHRIPLSQTSGPIELDVSNSSGEVTVHAGDGPDALVRFVKTGSRGGRFDETELVIEVHDSRIKIEPRASSGRGSILAGLRRDSHTAFNISVELPRERLRQQTGRVRVRTASGDVHIEEIDAEIRVTTASGDARVSDAAGNVTLQTASGDQSILRPHGEVTIHSASGDIHVDDGVLSRFAIATASGDAHISAELAGDASSKVDTVSGDVSLTLASVLGGELRFTTVSGDASIEAPFRKIAGRNWRLGESDSGGPIISVKSVNGDLHVRGSVPATATAPIRRADAVADTAPLHPPHPPTSMEPPAPTPPTPPAPPPLPDAPIGAGQPDVAMGAIKTPTPSTSDPVDESERLTLLQALERGEIDIDEAMSRLDDLDESVGA